MISLVVLLLLLANIIATVHDEFSEFELSTADGTVVVEVAAAEFEIEEEKCALVVSEFTTLRARSLMSARVQTHGGEEHDANRDGRRSFKEMVGFLQTLDDGEQTKSHLRVMFDAFDEDHDGVWSRDEYQAFKRRVLTQLILDRILIAFLFVLVVILSACLYFRRKGGGGSKITTTTVAPLIVEAGDGAKKPETTPATPTPATPSTPTPSTPIGLTRTPSTTTSDSPLVQRISRTRNCMIDEKDLEITSEKLGRGIGGDVVVGVWQKTTRVACKALRDMCSQREVDDFAQEINLLQSLPTHPNIVQLYGICTTSKGDAILVMELLKDGSLHAALRKIGSDISLTQRLLFASDICVSFYFCF